MAESARPLLVCCLAALLATGCTHTIGGAAVRTAPAIDEDSQSPVDVETVMLGTARMRAITGAGLNLTIIPSMDGKLPVDIDELAELAPPQCQWVFAETQTFGPDVQDFHKTTFQNPPKRGLISEGAAAYRDPDSVGRAFTALLDRVDSCGSTSYGPLFVGDWTATSDSLQMRPLAACDRNYRVKSVVLIEVTSCSFPDSVADLVMTNMLDNVPD